jgi:hypothetical protein
MVACILTLARFCAPSSELRIADYWYGKTALDDLLGVAPEKVNDDRLYRGLDALLPRKDALFGHFQQVYGELFGTTYDLLLYDAPRPISRARPRPTLKPNAATRAIRAPIACRSASRWW